MSPPPRPPGHFDRIVLFLIPWAGALLANSVSQTIGALDGHPVLLFGAILLVAFVASTAFEVVLERTLTQNAAWLVGVALARWSDEPWKMESMIRKARQAYGREETNGGKKP